MSQLDIQTATLDEIVFEDRNKSFGGYFLRVLYDWNITKAVIISCVTFTVVALGIYFYYRNQPVEADVFEEVEVNMTLESKPIDDNPDKLLPPPPPPKIDPPKVEIVKFIPPVIKPDKLVQNEEPIADADSLNDKTVGKINQDGKKGLNEEPIPEDPGPPGGGNEEGKIFTYVGEMPVFKGAKGEIEKYITIHTIYPQAALNKGIEGRVYVEFVVQPNGTVTNIKAVQGRGSIDPLLEQEAIRVVKGMPNQWTPGKNNGVAVPVRLQVPFIFKVPK